MNHKQQMTLFFKFNERPNKSTKIQSEKSEKNNYKHTTANNAQTEEEDGATKITTKTGFVRTIDCDYSSFVFLFRLLNYNYVVEKHLPPCNL